MGENQNDNPIGTIAQFREKLASSEFQNALNVSIQNTINGEESPVYTNSTTPTRVQIMNQLSQEIPDDLTRVYVTGEYDSQSFFADYIVDKDKDKAEVEDENAPTIVKPVIFFPS